MLEGMGFALAIGAFLYLAYVNPQWPLGPAPDLLWSGHFTLLLLPNLFFERAAREENLFRVRILLVVMTVAGIALVALRIMEFATLPVRWDENAYGSLLWTLLGLHTTHVVTDLAYTIVVAVLMFTRHGFGRRFSDVEANAFYWYFVVLTWPPTYFVLYWMPRL